jgi:hypothetical protein
VHCSISSRASVNSSLNAARARWVLFASYTAFTLLFQTLSKDCDGSSGKIWARDLLHYCTATVYHRIKFPRPSTPLLPMAESRTRSESQALLHNLHYFSETAPAVAKAIFSHVKPNPNALRGTSQLLRAAVNRTVSTVSFVAPQPTANASDITSDITSDLGITFPNATRVSLDILDIFLLQADCAGAAYLAHLVEACPRLLAGLQAMDMKLPDDFLHQPSVTQLALFLSG